MFLCTLGDLVSRLSDENEITDFSIKALDPLVILRMFVISSCDEECRSRHRLDSLNRCIRVCSLGVIIIRNAETLSYILDPVFDSLELLTCLADHIHRHTQLHRDRNRCHHILVVVSSDDI